MLANRHHGRGLPSKAYSIHHGVDINSTFLGMTHPGSSACHLSANRARHHNGRTTEAQQRPSPMQPMVQNKGSGTAINKTRSASGATQSSHVGITVIRLIRRCVAYGKIARVHHPRVPILSRTRGDSELSQRLQLATSSSHASSGQQIREAVVVGLCLNSNRQLLPPLL